MGDVLKNLRLRSQKRKKLLAQTLGLSTVDDLKHVLGTAEDGPPSKAYRPHDDDDEDADFDAADEDDHRHHHHRPHSAAGHRHPSGGASSSHTTASTSSTPSGHAASVSASAAHSKQFYRDSSTFLKGTQSSNPHNDYCQHFVDTGHRPQNFIRDVGLADRFEEYPKLRELIRLKDELIAETATPPMYLRADLKRLDLNQLGSKFDVILIEPPLEEYARGGAAGVAAASGGPRQFWSWDEIQALDIGEVAAHRSFVFLWCGSSEGLDMGRNCLRRWGFRRCEDICWIRTNNEHPGHSKILEPKAVFQRTKEHCLMGIKGTVRRSTDGDFIHANVDIDLIISEEEEFGSVDKPIELFHIIEHFCLGRRRLHVFGRDAGIRPGWLTVGPELTNSNFNADLYAASVAEAPTTGCTERIETLRPKSPPTNGKAGMRGRGGGRGYARGGGGGRGSGAGIGRGGR